MYLPWVEEREPAGDFLKRVIADEACAFLLRESPARFRVVAKDMPAFQ